MLFGKLKKAIQKLFRIKKKSLIQIEITHNHQPDYVIPNYPPTCHMIRYPERMNRPGTQAIHKVSPKQFKPRTAHEKRLLNPKAKLEEKN